MPLLLSSLREPGLPVKGSVLKWARESAGYTIEAACKKISPNVEKWEQALSFPTYKQLKKVADYYKRPVAVFFFPEPPKEEKAEISLRLVTGHDVAYLSPKIRFLFKKAKAFQISLRELYADQYTAQQQKTSWLRMAKEKQSMPSLAEEIRKVLGADLVKQKPWRKSDQALKYWRGVLAENGVYSFKNAFDNNKVSGFCVWDEQFPIIYLNNSTNQNRQIFTLFHELAHLLLQQNNLDTHDYDNYGDQEQTSIERECDRFAADFLVPTNDFLATIQSYRKITGDALSKLADLYGVSQAVILKKSLDLKKISRSDFDDQWKAWQKNSTTNKPVKKESGGDPYNTTMAYLGNHYLQLVLQKYHQGVISKNDAAEHLNIKHKNFDTIEYRFFAKKSP